MFMVNKDYHKLGGRELQPINCTTKSDATSYHHFIVI